MPPGSLQSKANLCGCRISGEATINLKMLVVLSLRNAIILQEDGCSPLSIACKLGILISVELLLEYGANPNGCDNVRKLLVCVFCLQ